MREYFTSLAPWRELLSNDFNRGYLAGVGIILLVFLLLLALKIIFSLLFRTRRCREITVPAGDGDVMIAYSAVESAIRAVLADFPALSLREAKLYRHGKRYSLYLICNFHASSKDNFPEEIKAVKKAIFETLRKMFAVENVRKIRIRLEKFTSSQNEAVTEEAPPAPAQSFSASKTDLDVINSGF